MDLGGLFLNRGNMSFKHGHSAKYPDVSKPHLWNSGGGPYTSGAVHVSLTAVVVEVHQTCGPETTPTAGSPALLLAPLMRSCFSHTDVHIPRKETTL